MNYRRLFAVATQVLVGASFAIFFLFPRLRISGPSLGASLEIKLREIVSSDDTFTALTPSSTTAYFIYTSERTNMLAYCEPAPPHAIHLIAGSQGTWSVYKWSPDQRYLVFQVKEPNFHDYPGAPASKQSWLMLLDASTQTVRRLTEVKSPVIESGPVWLDNHSVLFDSIALEHNFAQPTRMIFDNHIGTSRNAADSPEIQSFPQLADVDYRIVSKSINGCYIKKFKQYLFLNSEFRTIAPVLNRCQLDLTQLQWVNFSPARDEVLFCATLPNSPNRCLFKTSIYGENMMELSSVHSYNGKWLGNSSGFAYVACTNNCFYLAVRPDEDGAATNLFCGGWCRTFTPNPDGTKIYAEASKDSGPCGLWEYDIKRRELQLLAPGNRMPLRNATVISPEMREISAADGGKIPFYYFHCPPGRSVRGAVIAIPPRTDQMSRYYQTRPQFMANAGFDYIAVNYRGCDGYGTAASSQYDPRRAAQDVLSVVNQLISTGEIDQRSLLLCAQSAGGEVLGQVLENGTNRWRACVLIRSELQREPEGSHAMMPMLFVCGDNDSAFGRVQANVAQLIGAGWPVALKVIRNQAHLYVDPVGRWDEEESVASFVIQQLNNRPR